MGKKNAIEFGVDGDSRDAIRNINKLGNAVIKLTEKMDKSGRRSKKSSDDSAAGLKTLALQYISVSAAVNIVRDAERALREERKEGARGILTGEQATGKLLQISGGDPGKARQLKDVVRALRLGAGLGREEATKLLFTGVSVGLAEAIPTLAELTPLVEGQPSQVLTGISKIGKAFGEEETGGFRQRLNKLLEGSRVSEIGLLQFAPAVVRAAQPAAAVKGSDEELIAILSQVIGAAASPEIAATQVGAFADKLLKQGLGGRGIIAGFEDIQAKGLSQEQLQKFFGEKRAFKGFGIIEKNIDAIREALALVQQADVLTGTGKDATAGLLQIARGDPELVAARRRRVSGQRELIAREEEFGVSELSLESVLKNISARDIEEGRGAFTRFGRRKLFETFGRIAELQDPGKGAGAVLGFASEGELRRAGRGDFTREDVLLEAAKTMQGSAESIEASINRLVNALEDQTFTHPLNQGEGAN